ncbi:DUF2785 domain-containing protein [Pseudoxanthomonas sp. F37]|uniref:DUF2785 domain-containing protein n=1 Tax=Pseudoxanthomonas TaxID=83618 RepID=UPI001FD2E5B7|nr:MULTISPECIES: DUF2785 domain-containing protein [Pseudoxanthomonas]UOV06168.1 DUF2785 domain-containing protein [Pseudoxanthomonas mexicana]UOV07748.1 DUF2785 domain-containing protein [Pseudoxanthomonas sp. F37]
MRSRAWLAWAGVVLSWSAQAACPPEGTDPASLQLLREQKFAVTDHVRATLVAGLPACLAHPDPALRDGVAYEGLSTWLRAGQLDAEQRRALRDHLYAMLGQEDPAGFGPPFAALVLSEVARTDRIAPWMSAEERADMVARAAAYLASVRDYRGFDAVEGWRHGVAHGADWLLQLVLNEQVDRAQVEVLLQAVAEQAVPENAHAYVFGEPGRLARPVLYAARRGLLDEAAWTRWFAALPPRLGVAEQAYADSAWLARRHDLMAFLMSLHLEADQSGDPQIRALKPMVVQALKAVP